jgi:hypothetical protein
MTHPSNEVVPVNPTVREADLAPLPSLGTAREFARRSKAENTLRGYRADWREFCG